MSATALNRRVLLVDDEPLLLAGLKRDLRRDYEIEAAAGGRQALELLAGSPPFAVVVSDFNMPGMDGVSLLKEVSRVCPETITVMLTGNAEQDVAARALQEGRIFRFLSKPCSRELIRKTLEDAVEQHRLIVSERQLKAELTAANAALTDFNQQLEERVRQRTATIQRLQEFVAGLNGLDTAAEVWRLLAHAAADLLHGRLALLFLPGAGSDECREAARCLTGEDCPPAAIAWARTAAQRVLATGRSVCIADAEEARRLDLPCPATRDAVFPLATTLIQEPEGPVGVLCVGGRSAGGAYEEQELAALRALAESAGIALTNQRRRDERNRARDAIIMALAKLAEHRDPETGAHLGRVQGYCSLIAGRLADRHACGDVISPLFLENLHRSAPLHDIGKVGIPDRILLKPGRLTPDEFEIMKRHTIIGGDTLRALIEDGQMGSFLQMAMDIAYSHHEKFDGSGYPFRLAGEEIPLAARILALADVYDALTSRRVYKPAMSHQQAAGIIRQGRGTHFDPEVVSAFESLEDRFREIADHLGDLPEEELTPAEMLVSI